MANWNLPTVTSTKVGVLTELAAKDTDSATLFKDVPSNQPEGSIRYHRTNNLFQESLSSVWTDKVLAIAGGGTGASSASTARSNLGLGTMATQNASAVAITGGTVEGITSLTVAGNITPTTDDTRAIGSNAAQFQKAYYKTGLKIPVGTDKYLTG